MNGKSLLLAALFITATACSSRGPKDPFTTVSADDVSKNAGADPVPPAGTKILAPMPLARARTEMAAFAGKDPAVSPLASVGADESGVELHVVIENRGKCAIKSVEGVAYGFDAKGAPAKMNKSGINFVAFKTELKIEPGKKGVVSQRLKNVDVATNSVAQIDKTECADGTSWVRK